jgi:hypothetical protein
MKDLAKLAALLLATILLVVVIHLYLEGLRDANPVPVYYEVEPGATPTYYDPSTNYGYSSYPYPGYYPTLPPTPTGSSFSKGYYKN